MLAHNGYAPPEHPRDIRNIRNDILNRRSMHVASCMHAAGCIALVCSHLSLVVLHIPTFDDITLRPVFRMPAFLKHFERWFQAFKGFAEVILEEISTEVHGLEEWWDPEEVILCWSGKN